MPPPYPDPQSFTNNKAVVAATIASDQAKSASIPIRGMDVVGIYIPAGLAGSVTALTFEVSDDDTTFVQAKNPDNTAITHTLNNTAGYQKLSSIMDLAGANFVKLVVNNAPSADAAFKLALKGLK
jgi:hypothetical protein